VLVICGDDLVTGRQVVREGDTIELRPVMSGARGLAMSAQVRETASSSCAANNAAFCAPDFLEFFRTRSARRSASTDVSRETNRAVASPAARTRSPLWDV